MIRNERHPLSRRCRYSHVEYEKDQQFAAKKEVEIYHCRSSSGLRLMALNEEEGRKKLERSQAVCGYDFTEECGVIGSEVIQRSMFARSSFRILQRLLHREEVGRYWLVKQDMGNERSLTCSCVDC